MSAGTNLKDLEKLGVTETGIKDIRIRVRKERTSLLPNKDFTKTFKELTTSN